MKNPASVKSVLYLHPLLSNIKNHRMLSEFVHCGTVNYLKKAKISLKTGVRKHIHQSMLS